MQGVALGQAAQVLDQKGNAAEGAVGQRGGRLLAGLVEAGVDASVDVRGHRPNQLTEFILAEANKFGADLIIIGGHHSHGMRDRLFGDIGRTLAHGSKCPLLLMPSGPE